MAAVLWDYANKRMASGVDDPFKAAVEAFFRSPAAAAPLPEGKVWGISWKEPSQKYGVHVKKAGQSNYMGAFKSKTVAARVYGEL